MAERLSEYHVIEPGFSTLINPNMRLVRLWTGAAWAEGPVWFGDAGQLLFSDIPNDRIMRFVPDLTGLEGWVSVFRQPAHYTNGHTRDREGRLVSCSHGARAILRTEHDGRITTLVERFEGRRLNSPNDVVVRHDGTIWFSDPPYGILSDLEGWRGEMEYGAAHLFRFDPADGSLRVAADDFLKPNGLAFSPDHERLYVADTGATHDPDGPRHIRVFEVGDDGALKGGEVFATCDAGLFDGFRIDTEGRLWSSAGDGVHVFDTDGTLLGKILVPEVVANVCFGGQKKNRLFICGTTSLYAVYAFANGAQFP